MRKISRCSLGLVALAGVVSAAPPADDSWWGAARVTRMSASPLPVTGGPAALEAVEEQLRVGGPALRLGACALGVELDYQYTRYEYTGIDGRDRDQHRLQIPLRFGGAAGGWELGGFIAPGVSTSSNVFNEPFNRWTRKDLIVTAAFEAHYPAREGWQWILGVAHDRAFGAPTLYPIAGAQHTGSAAWTLRLAFPEAELRYAPGERHALLLRVYPAGHQWHVVSDELNDRFDYVVQAMRAELTWSLRLWDRLRLDLTAGRETARDHRFTDDLGARIDADPDDQWLVGVGLRLGDAPLPYTHGQRR